VRSATARERAHGRRPGLRTLGLHLHRVGGEGSHLRPGSHSDHQGLVEAGSELSGSTWRGPATAGRQVRPGRPRRQHGGSACDVHQFHPAQTELKALWTDPQFDPACMRSTRALEFHAALDYHPGASAGHAPPDVVAATVQERAWSSPIWYTRARRTAGSPASTTVAGLRKQGLALTDEQLKTLWWVISSGYITTSPACASEPVRSRDRPSPITWGACAAAERGR
jgi:hypothetical protein